MPVALVLVLDCTGEELDFPGRMVLEPPRSRSFPGGVNMIIATLERKNAEKQDPMKIVTNHETSSTHIFLGVTIHPIYLCCLNLPIVAFDFTACSVPRYHVDVGAWAVVAGEGPTCAARRTHCLRRTKEKTGA